jgi:esterase
MLHWSPIVGGRHDPARWFAVLHGIYGRGRNWTSVARQVVDRRPEWAAMLVDLRLHGDSPPMPPPHTIDSAADDVRRLVQSISDAHPVAAVVGHSFGGKVALRLAEPLLARLAQVWMIDSTPEPRTPSGSAWDLLALLRSLPARFASRAEAVTALEAHGCSTLVARWMSTNLQRTNGDFVWALDLDAIELLLRDFFDTDLWHVIESPPGALTLHVVKAEASSTLGEEACARVVRAGEATGRVQLHRVPGGHWLNVENPQAIVELLAAELP